GEAKVVYTPDGVDPAVGAGGPGQETAVRFHIGKPRPAIGGRVIGVRSIVGAALGDQNASPKGVEPAVAAGRGGQKTRGGGPGCDPAPLAGGRIVNLHRSQIVSPVEPSDGVDPAVQACRSGQTPASGRQRSD